MAAVRATEHPDDAESLREEARRQYLLGAYNRLAKHSENLAASFPLIGEVIAESGARFTCTRGRLDCDQTVCLTLREYDEVRAKPYRFVVAPGHETEADEVVARYDGYTVVEVRAEYRVS